MSDPLKIDYVADWRARLRSRLYTQFRSTDSWEQWVQFLGDGAQDLEDAAQSILTWLDIDNLSGVQLDRVGRLIGQPRLSFSETLYRLLLKARIAANRSKGTVEDIYTVLRTLLDGTLVYIPGFVKQFAVRVEDDTPTPLQALAAVLLLGVAREAGARAILQWQEYANTEMFTFGDTWDLTPSGQGFDAGYFEGAAQAP